MGGWRGAPGWRPRWGRARRRGRRLPDPRLQHVRRPRCGAWVLADRGRTLRVPRWRVAAAVDARAAAAAPVAQGRRGDTGVVLTVAASGSRPGRSRSPPRRRARAAHGVDGPVHGGSGVAGMRATRRRRVTSVRPSAGGGAPASPSRSRSSPCCSCGRPPRAKPAEAHQPRRVRAAPHRAPRHRRRGRLLPATPRRLLAVIVGAVLSVLVLVKVLDIGFFTAFDRPFAP